MNSFEPTLYIFLFIYAGALLLWLVFSLVAIFHILKFGFRGFLSALAITVYIGGSFLIFSVSFYFIKDINWERVVSLDDLIIISDGMSGLK